MGNVEMVISDEAWVAVKSVVEKYDIKPSDAILKMHRLFVAAQGAVGSSHPSLPPNIGIDTGGVK